MDNKLKGPGDQTGAGAHLARESAVTVIENAPERQAETGLSFLGPKVGIKSVKGGFFVKIANRPWGFQFADKICLTERSARAYAEKLNDKLVIKQLRDELLKARRRERRLLERLAEGLANGGLS